MNKMDFSNDWFKGKAIRVCQLLSKNTGKGQQLVALVPPSAMV
ncbi:MAG: hypothetical protein ABG776_06505 [Cyanobacteria bacterium J06555_13]